MCVYHKAAECCGPARSSLVRKRWGAAVHCGTVKAKDWVEASDRMPGWLGHAHMPLRPVIFNSKHTHSDLVHPFKTLCQTFLHQKEERRTCFSSVLRCSSSWSVSGLQPTYDTAQCYSLVSLWYQGFYCNLCVCRIKCNKCIYAGGQASDSIPLSLKTKTHQ